MYQYKIASQAYFYEIKDFMKNQFFINEPICSVLNLSENEVEIFLHELLPSILNEKLSVIALKENKIVGCLLCEDFYNKISSKKLEFNPKFFPLFTLLDELDNFILKSESFQANQSLHILMIATAEKGIAQELCQFALDHAQRCHFKDAILEATGPVSQFLAQNKLGFNSIYQIDYDKFQYMNVHTFKSIQGTKSCVLFRKKIS